MITQNPLGIKKRNETKGRKWNQVGLKSYTRIRREKWQRKTSKKRSQKQNASTSELSSTFKGKLIKNILMKQKLEQNKLVILIFII
jgi:hypothetical protein